MGLTSRDLRRGLLIARVDKANPRHVHLSIFDQGANAGRLVLDRETYEAICGIPETDGQGWPVEVRPLSRAAIVARLGNDAAAQIATEEIRP